jgi:hypothetical protein
MRIQKVGYAICVVLVLISASWAQVSGIQETFSEIQQELQEIEQRNFISRDW